MDIARALGQAERATQLYELFRGYLFNAFESIVALLGLSILEVFGDQVAKWVEKVKEGEPVSSLLERLYETEPTIRTLRQVAGDSEAELSRYGAAIEGVGGLSSAFHGQKGPVDKLLPKLQLLTLGLPAAVPQGR